MTQVSIGAQNTGKRTVPLTEAERKIKMKKKYLKSVIGIGVGVVLLTTAVFANYESAGGYSLCKNALKKLAFEKNFSADYTGEFLVDNESYGKIFGSYKLAVGDNPSLQAESTEEDKEGIYYSKRTVQDDIDIHESNMKSTGGTRGEAFQGYYYDKYGETSSIAGSMANDEEIGEKIVFWVETLADALVGDLKNSFVLTSNEGGVSKYNISLTKEQMPSYITAGVSLLTTSVRNDNSMEINGESGLERDPYCLMFGKDEPYVSDVTINMSVDDKGNPLQITGVLNIIGYDIDGGEHVMAIKLSMDFYDFGSTAIERVSSERIKSFNNYTASVYEKEETAVEELYDDEAVDDDSEKSIGIIGGADGPTAVYIK